MANSGSVNQLNRNAAQGDSFAHQIARGAGGRGHNRALALDQTVEQARLSNIRPADDGEGQPLMNDFAVGKRGGELFEGLADRVDAFENCRIRQDRNIVFREVDARFEQRNQFDQLLFDWLQALRKRSFKLLCCHLCLIQRLRFDQITNRLRLRQIDAAVEKSAHGELARFGKPRSCGQAHLDNVSQYDRRPVRADFYDVVGGVGMWFGEVGDDDFVDTLRRRAFRFY